MNNEATERQKVEKERYAVQDRLKTRQDSQRAAVRAQRIMPHATNARAPPADTWTGFAHNQQEEAAKRVATYSSKARAEEMAKLDEARPKRDPAKFICTFKKTTVDVYKTDETSHLARRPSIPPHVARRLLEEEKRRHEKNTPL